MRWGAGLEGEGPHPRGFQLGVVVHNYEVVITPGLLHRFQVRAEVAEEWSFVGEAHAGILSRSFQTSWITSTT
jgi:hypothetical protein